MRLGEAVDSRRCRQSCSSTPLTPSTPVALLVPAQTAMAVGLAMSFTPLFSSSLGSLERSLYSDRRR